MKAEEQTFSHWYDFDFFFLFILPSSFPFAILFTVLICFDNSAANA